MIYTSTLAAIVSALAAETIDNTSKQAWQKLYRPGYQDGLDLATLFRSGGETISRKEADCWVFSRLHSQLKPRHWAALLARYSTHKGRKVDSIGKLVPLVATHAPRLFLEKAVTAWAIPPLKGMEASSGREVISRAARDQARSRAWLKSYQEGGLQGMSDSCDRNEYVKRSTDMIVLPKRFYDMETWDDQGLNRTTYWRWRRQIEECLDGMVKEAVGHSEEILRSEGVLLDVAA
jgi:hypothetical protein